MVLFFKWQISGMADPYIPPKDVALVALCIQNQDSLVLKITNISNGRSFYSIEGRRTRSTVHSKSRFTSSENDRDHKIPSTTSWVLLWGVGSGWNIEIILAIISLRCQKFPKKIWGWRGLPQGLSIGAPCRVPTTIIPTKQKEQQQQQLRRYKDYL